MNDVVTVTTFYLDVMYAGIDGGDGAWAMSRVHLFLESRHLLNRPSSSSSWDDSCVDAYLLTAERQGKA